MNTYNKDSNKKQGCLIVVAFLSILITIAVVDVFNDKPLVILIVGGIFGWIFIFSMIGLFSK